MQVLSGFQDVVGLAHQKVRVLGDQQVSIGLSSDPFQHQLRWRLEMLQIAVINSHKCHSLFAPHLDQSFVLTFDLFVANAYDLHELYSLIWPKAKKVANTSPAMVLHCVFDDFNLHSLVQISPFWVGDLKRQLTLDSVHCTNTAKGTIYLPHQGAPDSHRAVDRHHYPER